MNVRIVPGPWREAGDLRLIKDAPEYDDSRDADETYCGELGSYYDKGGRGYTA